MKNSKIQVRRKPRQSRAKLTQEALQESFVRLLQQHSVNKITIREITELAGVGLGTFYEYFSRKEDLIALTIHLQIKHNAETLESYAHNLIKLSTNWHIHTYLQQIIQFQLQEIQVQQFLWAQIFLLERQVSSIDSYRKSYVMMVQIWQHILTPFIQDTKQLEQLSLNLQRICYGFISQTLIVMPKFKEWDSLEKDIIQIINQIIPQ